MIFEETWLGQFVALTICCEQSELQLAPLCELAASIDRKSLLSRMLQKCWFESKNRMDSLNAYPLSWLQQRGEDSAVISTTIRSQAEEGCLESTHRWPLSSRQPREVEISSAEMEVYWRAVLSKNARFDGLFVYAVRSTGIFCRPSCPARRPRRDNVVFYRAMDMARLAGFRPCRRCHPQMYEQVLLKQHQDRELEIARDVQRAMQPVEPPRIDGWDMSCGSRPLQPGWRRLLRFHPMRKRSRHRLAG